MMKVLSRRFALVTFLLFCFAVVPAGISLGACAVDPEVSLAVTRLDWVFNPQTGLFQMKGEVMNVSGCDVLSPGIAVGFVDDTGKEFDSSIAPGTARRIRPGERTAVRLSMKLARVPGSVRVLPFQASAGT